MGSRTRRGQRALRAATQGATSEPCRQPHKALPASLAGNRTRRGQRALQTAVKGVTSKPCGQPRGARPAGLRAVSQGAARRPWRAVPHAGNRSFGLRHAGSGATRLAALSCDQWHGLVASRAYASSERLQVQRSLRSQRSSLVHCHPHLRDTSPHDAPPQPATLPCGHPHFVDSQAPWSGIRAANESQPPRPTMGLVRVKNGPRPKREFLLTPSVLEYSRTRLGDGIDISQVTIFASINRAPRSLIQYFFGYFRMELAGFVIAFAVGHAAYFVYRFAWSEILQRTEEE
ncbi:hypothetical protein Dimus_026732 [Dionaea muscipula]